MADFFNVIKKNAGWYFVSMLVTGSTAFAAIVITKRWLSPEMFIRFNLKLNAIFMINTICLSWISLSIYRMYHQKREFFKTDNLVMMALSNALILGLPLMVTWYWLIKPGGTFLWPFTFLFIAFCYQIVLVSHQAALNAKRTTIAETIRGVSTLILMILPVVLKMDVGENYFWMVWVCAYLMAFFPLLYKTGNSLMFIGKDAKILPKAVYFNHLKEVFHFGWPFVIWMFFSFLLSFADRWYIAGANLPEGKTADYLALVDSVFRGCGFLFVPLNTSGFPVISRMYDEGNMPATYKLILKVVKTELLLLLGAIILTLLFHRLIFSFLNITTLSGTTSILLLATLMLGHGMWQICGMIQKPAELKMKTIWLALANALGSGLVYALLYLVVQPKSVLGIVLCLCSGILFYCLLVGFQLYKFGKTKLA